MEKENILSEKANIFIAWQISENIRLIVDLTDVYNSNIFIVHETVIPYGKETKLFYFIYLFILFINNVKPKALWEQCVPYCAIVN
jgi:hypothetical protein